MNARGQRAFARRYRREAVKEVPAGPREENPVESDTEEEDILEEIRFLYISSFQVLEVEVVLQRLKFLLESIQGCGCIRLTSNSLIYLIWKWRVWNSSWTISDTVTNVIDNCYGKYNYLSWRSSSRLSETKAETTEKVAELEKDEFKSCCAYIRRIPAENGEVWLKILKWRNRKKRSWKCSWMASSRIFSEKIYSRAFERSTHIV